MIVMRLGCGLITGASIAEIMPVENARLFEQAHGAVNGGDGNSRVDGRSALEQQLDVGMVFAFGTDAGNHPALLGDAQSFVSAQLFKIAQTGRASVRANG